MQELKNVKFVGGIGAILTLFSGLPTVGWAIGLAGLVMLVFAIKKIVDITGKKSIFLDYIKAFILGGISLIIFFIFIFGLIIEIGLGFRGRTLIFILIAYLCAVSGAYFQKRSFAGIARETGEKTFETAGNFYFLGAILLIILIGFLIQFVASILTIVAFFSLPEELKKL